jgi:hypothetical protein
MVSFLMMLLAGLSPQKMEAWQICTTAIYLHPPMRDVRQVPGALPTCLDVAETALDMGVNPVAAVATAYHESRFRDVPCRKGQLRMAAKGLDRMSLPTWCEQGPLQIKPKWHCPDRKYTADCDTVRQGVGLLGKLYDSSPSKHRESVRWGIAFAQYKHFLQPDGQYGVNVSTRMRRLNLKLRRIRRGRRI